MQEPLITPAMAFYCVIGVVAIDLLYLIIRKAMRDANSKSPIQAREE